jgi:hypothetical protein
MKKFLKSFYSSLLLVSFFLLAVASSGVKHMDFSVEGGQIPPDFKSCSDTLLVIKNPSDWGYDHYLFKNFKDNYTGPYKIISYKDLAGYPSNMYRYVFNNTINYTTKTTTTSTPIGSGYVKNGASVTSSYSSTYASSSIFSVLDRQTGKFYHTKSSAEYSKLMRAYIKALETNRKS